MWDYARMTQIANKLGGPIPAAAALVTAGIVIGGTVVELTHRMQQQIEQESQRKADMALQAQLMQSESAQDE